MTATVPPQIEFDASTHVYRVGGIVYPSVTQVIEAMGLSDYSRIPPDELAYYQQRGTFVHLATQYDDEGELDESSLTDDVLIRVEAWRKLRRDLLFRIVEAEQPRFDKFYGYCGTPDIRLVLPNRDEAIIDKKSGPIIPAARIQTAAYANFFKPHGAGLRRFAAHLKGDGTYMLQEFPQHEMARDFSVFASALNVMRWRQEHIR